VSSALRHDPDPALVSDAVRRAWNRYLTATRDAPPAEYAAVEEHAWRRLVSNLAALGVPLERP
jgi:hypothetical protein